MPIDGMTFAKWPASLRGRLANSAGVLLSGCKPCSFIFAIMSCVFSAATAAALSLSMIGAGVPAGASRPFQPTLMTPGTVSSIVGVSGNSGSRVFSTAAMTRIPPACPCGGAAGLRLRERDRQRVEPHLDVAGEQVLHRERAAAIWHVHHVDADLLLEQLAADVVARADAGSGVGELAGILPRVFDELGHIVHR